MRKLFVLSIAVAAVVTSAYGRDVRDVLGVNHWGGKYSFTTTDYLNEGAARAQTLGTRVIKVALSGTPGSDYPFHSSYPAVSSLRDTANTPHFQALFARDFSTFILICTTPGDPLYAAGFDDTAYETQRREFHDLAALLIQRYAYTGKTFVLQNWEMDSKMSGLTSDAAYNNAKRFITARQEGVNQARAENASISGVTVLHGVEVNFVQAGMAGSRTVVNNVLPYLGQPPYLKPDLFAYSAWDMQPSDISGEEAAARLTQGLDYLKQQAGAERGQVYLSEYGYGENTDGHDAEYQRDRIRMYTEAALAWGVRYAVEWELFSNEGTSSEAGNQWWLVRDNGTLTPAWDYLASKMGSSIYRVNLQNVPYAKYMSAMNGGGSDVVANWTTPLTWESLLITDLNGGSFVPNDHVTVQSVSGHFFSAQQGGGGAILANIWEPITWENFTIIDDFPSDGVLVEGDNIVLTSYTGYDVTARSSSDPAYPGMVRADGVRPSPTYVLWESLWVMHFLTD